MMDTYRNIREFRKRLGMSQEELAKLTGYTDRSSIAKIESGKVDLPQSKIKLFAHALHVSPGDLMGEDGVEPLTDMEQMLLSFFRKLNQSGQEKAMKYIVLLGEKEVNRKKLGISSDSRIG